MDTGSSRGMVARMFARNARIVDVGAGVGVALRCKKAGVAASVLRIMGLVLGFAVACSQGRVAAGTGRWDGWRKTQSG